MVGAVWLPGKPRTISSSDRARGAGLDRRLASDGIDPNQGGARDGAAGRGGGAGVSRLSLPCSSPRRPRHLRHRSEPTRSRVAGPSRGSSTVRPPQSPSTGCASDPDGTRVRACSGPPGGLAPRRARCRRVALAELQGRRQGRRAAVAGMADAPSAPARATVRNRAGSDAAPTFHRRSSRWPRPAAPQPQGRRRAPDAWRLALAPLPAPDPLDGRLNPASKPTGATNRR